MFLSAKTPLLAVDIGSNSIKVAQVAGSANKYELLAFGVMPLEPEAVVDGIVKDEEHVADALTRLINAKDMKEKIVTPYSIASVAGEAVIIKKIQVPQMPKEELEETIKKEAEQYIPFDIDDVRIDYHPLGKAGGGAETIDDEEEEKDEILLVAVQNDIIESRAEVLTRAGLKPAVIDLDAFALVNALGISKNLEELGAVALIDLGASFTHINIIIDGVATFTRDIPIGGNMCTQALMSKFEAEYEEAEDFKKGILPSDIEKADIVETIVEAFESSIEEISKSFEFISTTSNAQVEHIFLTGGGALLHGVDGLIADRLGVSAEVYDPMQSIKISRKNFDRENINRMGPLAMVALGLSTRRFDYF